MNYNTPQPQFIASGLYEFYSNISSSTLVNLLTLLKKDPAKAVLNPFIREVLFSNLVEQDLPLCTMYYTKINHCLNFEGIDLSDLANFYAIELFSKVYLSFGTKQAFLKTLLTNYSITEQKLEERGILETIQKQQEEKKKKFVFI